MFVPNRQYDSQSGTKFHDYSNDSPYDTFMKKHLQHYGYFTGKNEKRMKDLEDWESTTSPDYKEYGSDDDYLNEALANNEKSEKELKSNQVVYNVNEGKVVTKLKEPRALFGGTQDSGLNPPKWPIEMEVLPDRVKHIDCPPEALEPFGSSNEFEPTLAAALGEGASRLVYKYDPVLSPFFIKSRVGGSKALSACQVGPNDGDSGPDDALVFESRFESGNLRKAYRVGPRDYELWLRTDLYTTKHTQWFYFRVSNTTAGQSYRFTLVNFYKSSSLYNEGLRPLMYSVKAAESRGIGWRRCATGIKYFRSNKRYSTPAGGDKCYYSLTWQTRFEHAGDTVYFAHCYPYTYSDLLDYLRDLREDPEKSSFCRQRVLCRSLAGNAVHLLTIGSAQEPQQQQQPPPQQKKVILVTARVHPGESNASWMMKGFLDHLTGGDPDARLLRDCFTFKVVPMINPDGVIVGNYRCSLAGRDLNRNYRTGLRDSFPAVCAIVDLVGRLQARGAEVALYCDLHGHSRRQNVFMYGCQDRAADAAADRLMERVFPAMMARNAPDKFAYDCCKFRMQKSKEGTGRMVLYRMGVRNSFTMEATFCGSTLGALGGHHFSCRHLEAMGAHLCDTLLDYFDPSVAKRDQVLADVERKLKVQIFAHLQRSGRCLEVASPDELSLAELPDGDDADSSDDGGSDSSVSDGLPAHYEYLKSRANATGGRRRRRRSRKELVAAASRRSSTKPPASSSAAAAAKRPVFCDRCGSARCPQNQAEKPGLTAGRQKSKLATSVPAPPVTCTRSAADATAGAMPSSQQPRQRIRSAAGSVTVERFAEGLKPVASDPSMRAVDSSATTAAPGGRGFEPADLTGSGRQKTSLLPQATPRNSVESLEPAAAAPPHRLLAQSRLAHRLLHYETDARTPAVGAGTAGLSRATSLEEAAAATSGGGGWHRQQRQPQQRIGRRSVSTNQIPPTGGVSSSAGLSMAQTGLATSASAAQLESFGSPNTRLLASNRVRMRHQLPGPRVTAPGLRSQPAAGEEEEAEAGDVLSTTSVSAASTATIADPAVGRREMPPSIDDSASPTAANAGAAASAVPTGQSRVSLPQPAQPPTPDSGVGRWQASSKLLPASCDNNDDGEYDDDDDEGSHRDRDSTISGAVDADELVLPVPPSQQPAGQQQQPRQRRPSQWRQSGGQQEIAQTFSQPTVVLSSGNRPPIPQLTNQSKPATISLQMTSPVSNQGSLIPKLPFAADAARRLSQFRATQKRLP